MKERLKAPELRFKGFTDEWEERKLGDITTWTKGQGLSKEYLNNERYGSEAVHYADLYKFSPVMQEVIHWTNSDDGRIIPDNSLLFPASDVTPVGLARTSTLRLSGVKAGGDVIIGQLSERINSSFMSYQINANSKKILPLITGTTVKHVQAKSLATMSVTITNMAEQTAIAGLFERIDNLIALHQRKLDLLKEQKKGYLQKMFPKNGAKVPELRFAGFADDWEERKLSSGLREYTDRVIVEDDKEYYQISVRNNFGGITLRGSKMGNKIGRKRQAKINLTKYPQTLIFTRQTVEQGGIGWVDKYCDGAIVTENMPTISLDTSVFSKYFLTNLFQTRIFYKNAILDNIEGGSAQIAIHESKFLSSTLLFPNLDEQEKIGQFFKQLDDTIDLHQRKLDLLKEQKKGFLQKMFV